MLGYVPPPNLHGTTCNTKIKVLSIRKGEELLTFSAHTGRVNNIIFSPDNSTIISCSDDKLISFWNFRTGEK
jgi:WD40 repeat protein